jgi:HSP20 family molecular chaperone IbpA
MRAFRQWPDDQNQDALHEQAKTANQNNVYTPALDIHETADGLVLEADLPGVPPDQLEVRVEDNVLYIRGKIRWPHPEQGHVLYEEIRPGDFYRSFILSDEVDPERITADFNKGVLRLTLPRATKIRPRKIEVRTSSGQSSSSGSSTS